MNEVVSSQDRSHPQATLLKITGMSCAGCARSVGQVLQQTPGVETADVNFAAEQARVFFHADQVSLEDMITAVERAGFGASSLPPLHLQNLEAEVETEIKQARQRLWLGAIPALILMGVMITCMILDLPHNQHHRVLTLTLAFPVVFVAGWPTHRASWTALRRGAPSMDVLISLGTLPTYLVGLTGIPEVTVFVEVAAMVMAFHLLSRFLERRARGQASQAIRHLIGLQAKQAHLIRSESETWVDVPISLVQTGDWLVVRPGEVIPVDGCVLKGESSVNEAIATGESMPVAKQKGDQVIGGTLNHAGRLVVAATHVGEEAFLAKMVQLMQEAQGSKVPIQQMADRITGYFVPAVVGLALLTFGLWYFDAEQMLPWAHFWETHLPWIDTHLSPLGLAAFNMIAVLVVACPCALGLATPVALMVGSGRGAEQGILIRNGEAVQALKSVTTVLLDKTGTLTMGEPQVTRILPEDNREAILTWAATAEQGSEHALARAILTAAQQADLPPHPLDEFTAVAGQGIQAVSQGDSIWVGSPTFLETVVDLSAWRDRIQQLQESGETVVGVVRADQVLGLLTLADQLKPDAVAAIAQLRSLGLEPVMVTGDHEQAAQRIAKQLGLTRYYAEVLPAGKVELIKQLQAAGEVVAMVGDGLNDAPALAQAQVGIAMGTGTDLAIEAADLTVAQGNLLAAVKAIRLAQATFSKVQQNLFWAYGYNVLAIPIAAAGLLHPIMAEIAMALSSLTVVWNSLRLRQQPLE
jgi:Cu+-exporting ATPase